MGRARAGLAVTVSAFGDATAIRPREAAPGEFDADLGPGWAIGGKPNGGYLLAILGRAACQVVDTRHPLAISAHYLRAPSSAPAEVRAEPIRHGRRVSTSRAAMWQDGKQCIDALVTSGELPDAPVEWSATPPPEMPGPDACPQAGTAEFTVELFENVDMRVDPATAPFPTPTGDARVRFWFRLRDGTPPDPWSLILAGDSSPPTVFNLGKYGWAPTVELTVLLRGLPAPGWLQCESRCTALVDGWFDEDCTVWDSTGRLVAQSRQLAIAGGR
jgi:acyl-CoA thioesterase